MTTDTKILASPVWNMDSIFEGGMAGDAFHKYRSSVKERLVKSASSLEELPTVLNNDTQKAWTEYILDWQQLCEDVLTIASFASCLASADVNDSVAIAGMAEGDALYAEWEKLKTTLESLAAEQPDDEWNKLVTTGRLNEIRFYLNEMREHASRKMSPEMEGLALDLAVDGYHGWGRIYSKMSGSLKAIVSSNGDTESMSVGQLATKMADPDREVRKEAFEKIQETWGSNADLSAMTLNSLAGFRMALYKRRGWDNILQEPLSIARLSEKTLDAMWRVITRETHKLAPYIDAKKKLLGIDKYRWYDEFAPCGKADKLFTFDEASEFVIKQTGAFSKDIAGYCRMAIDKGWVEAEDRGGKRDGAFCSSFGPGRQSRIFMTYAGSYDQMMTLAHELGHGYHQHVLSKTEYLATNYPMTVAETASIFNEMLVTDAALTECDDPQEKLMLLDQQLQQPYVFFCDVHSRFLFEKKFYAERPNGMVSKDRLCELMVEAQKEAFGSLLDESGHNPLFWTTKLHFHITDTPFYNFPYVFGYLFAGGVYDRAKKEGPAFADKYRALLLDSGSMSSEDVAMKHLGVDLTGESFWEDAVARSLSSVDEFVKLAETL